MFIRALREGMPDLHCPVEEVVAEGDRVAGRLFAARHAPRTACSAFRQPESRWLRA